jgi:hypothetical protein
MKLKKPQKINQILVKLCNICTWWKGTKCILPWYGTCNDCCQGSLIKCKVLFKQNKKAVQKNLLTQMDACKESSGD